MCLRVATFARLTLPADVSSLIDDIFVALFLFTAAANVYRAWVLNEGAHQAQHQQPGAVPEAPRSPPARPSAPVHFGGSSDAPPPYS